MYPDETGTESVNSVKEMALPCVCVCALSSLLSSPQDKKVVGKRTSLALYPLVLLEQACRSSAAGLGFTRSVLKL